MVGSLQFHSAEQYPPLWPTFLDLCRTVWSRFGRGGGPEKGLVGQSGIVAAWIASILAGGSIAFRFAYLHRVALLYSTN